MYYLKGKIQKKNSKNLLIQENIPMELNIYMFRCMLLYYYYIYDFHDVDEDDDDDDDDANADDDNDILYSCNTSLCIILGKLTAIISSLSFLINCSSLQNNPILLNFRHLVIAT